MSTRKELFAIHRIFISLMAVALLFGVVFFVTNNLDFIINAITYKKAHLPNIAYWFSKMVGTILLPLIFILPSSQRVERIKVLRYSFITYGALQILTLSWIFWYFGANGFDGFFSNEAIINFQSAKENGFVASYVYWDTYSWVGNIFTLLFGALCIYTGLNFDDNKYKVCYLLLAVCLTRLVLPIISNLCLGQGFLSSLWFANNYVDLLCLGAFTAAVFTAATLDATWISLIWDQEAPQSEDEA